MVGNAVIGGFLGYDAVTTGVNNVPSAPWLPLEFLRNPFPFGIQTAMGNRGGTSTMLGLAISDIPVRSLNQTPQEQAWSLGIQHQLPWSILVDAEYIGRKGTHLYAMGYANELDALPANIADAFRADPSYYLAQVPNPFQGLLPSSPIYPGRPFHAGSYMCLTRNTARGRRRESAAASFRGPIRFTTRRNYASRSASRTDCNSCSPTLFRRASTILRSDPAGYSFLTGGSTTSESSARDPNNLRLDRSLSVFSIPQIAQLSFVYQLPFGHRRKYGANINGWANALVGGWQVNGIYRIDDGLPVQLFLCGGCSISLPTYGNQYPNLLAPLQVAGTGNLNQYFANPQVAVKPAPYSDGDAPRVLSNARIPGTDNLTASLFKEVPLGFREGAKLQIRLEAFNRFQPRPVRSARCQRGRCHLRPDHQPGEPAETSANRSEALLLG